MHPLASLPLALLLAACDGGGGGVTATTNMVDGATPAVAVDTGGGTSYLCTDGRTVRSTFSDPETLTLHVGGAAVPMQATVAANGARYVGGGWQWWTRGLQQATLAPLRPGERVATAPAVPCRVR